MPLYLLFDGHDFVGVFELKEYAESCVFENDFSIPRIAKISINRPNSFEWCEDE